MESKLIDSKALEVEAEMNVRTLDFQVTLYASENHEPLNNSVCWVEEKTNPIRVWAEHKRTTDWFAGDKTYAEMERILNIMLSTERN